MWLARRRGLLRLPQLVVDPLRGPTLDGIQGRQRYKSISGERKNSIGSPVAYDWVEVGNSVSTDAGSTLRPDSRSADPYLSSRKLFHKYDNIQRWLSVIIDNFVYPLREMTAAL